MSALSFLQRIRSLPPQETARWLALSVAALLISTCSPALTPLERIQHSGVLRVVTYNSGTTYYEASYGPTGFDYDLASGFAEHLGVGLKIILADSPRDSLTQLARGRADIAAGLTITPERTRRFRFSLPLHDIEPQLVYRLGRRAPRGWDDLDAPVVVGEGSSHAERLARMKSEGTDIEWQATPDMNSEGLLGLVADGEIAYTIADSHLVAINMRYYSQLRVAFDAGPSEQLGWAFSQDPEPVVE